MKREPGLGKVWGNEVGITPVLLRTGAEAMGQGREWSRQAVGSGAL
jgi:hypothetical protein